MDAYLEFSKKDLFVVVLLSFLLLLTAQPLFSVRSIVFGRDYMYMVFLDGSLSFFWSPYLHVTVLLIAMGTVIVHELLHMLTLRIMCIDFKLKPVTIFRLPVAIQIDYNEIEVWQYMVTALSPQVLTIILAITARFTECLKIPIMLAAILNFASSSGDLYGIVKTVVKIRSVKGRIIKIGKLRYLIKL